MVFTRRILRAAKTAAGGGTSALVGANLAANLIGLVTGLVTARTLGPAARGDLAVVLFWPAFLTSLVDTGLTEAVAIRTAKRPRLSASLTSASFRIALAMAAVASALGIAALPWLLQPSQRGLLGMSRVAIAFVPASLISTVPIGILLGLQRFRTVASIRTGALVLYLTSLLALVALGEANVLAIMVLTVAVRLVTFLASAPLLLTLRVEQAREVVPVCEVARETLALQGARITTVLGSTQDKVLGNLTLPQAAIGHWQVVGAYAGVMQIAAQAFSQQVLSRIAARPAGGQRVVTSAYVNGVGFTTLGALATVPLLPLAVPLLYGPDFAPAAAAASVVALASITSAGASILQAAARGEYRVRDCMVSDVLGMAVMGIVALPAVDNAGLTGLALALLAGRSAALAWMIVRADPTIRPALVPFSPAFCTQALREWRQLLDSENGRHGVGPVGTSERPQTLPSERRPVPGSDNCS